MITQTDVQLPKYVDRAVSSRLSRREPFSLLSPEEWKELALHVYGDEFPVSEQRYSFFPRGSIYNYRSGKMKNVTIEQTLWAILDLAVFEHKGRTDVVPHYQKAERLYQMLEPKRELTDKGTWRIKV